jgi:hypothetical protein
VDNVRTNPDGTERDIEWHFQTIEDGKEIRYIAYMRGQGPKPRKGSNLLIKNNALGHLIYEPQEGPADFGE